MGQGPGGECWPSRSAQGQGSGFRVSSDLEGVVPLGPGAADPQRPHREGSPVGFQTWVGAFREIPCCLRLGWCRLQLGFEPGPWKKAGPCSLTGTWGPSLAVHLGLLPLVAPGFLSCLPPSLPPFSLLPPLHYRLPCAELLMAPDDPGVWEMTTTAAPPTPPTQAAHPL